MKAVYTHENGVLVQNAKNILDEAEIESVIKNEFASGGAGDLVPMETWPELCVLSESDYEDAKKLLKLLERATQAPDWLCKECSEYNGASFEYCWCCESLKPK